MVEKILLYILLFFLSFSNAFAENGFGIVKGRASYKGEVFSDVKILVYKEKEHINLYKPDLVATETKIDGSYEFKLSPGRYYLVALKKNKASNSFVPEEGDLYCFYSGSPVDVVENGITYVGFNLIKIGKTKQDKKTYGESGIFGKVLFDGKLLPKTYVYIYKDFKNGFRGPAYLVYPSFDGNFKINLPPGEYYILARKRAKGGMYGPIEEGDLFNFYYGNPVQIKKGFLKYVEIECVKRLSQLESDEGYPTLMGIVKDRSGKPVTGVFVLIYNTKEMHGKPLYISPRTNSNGEFSIKLPPGNYYILARENIGGPPVSGEWYGKYSEVLRMDNDQKINLIVEKNK